MPVSQWDFQYGSHLVTEGDFMAISFNSLVGHPWGQLGCQKKQKCSRNLNLLDFCSTFHPKVNKSRKTTRNIEKAFENNGFGVGFRSSFNFGWKVEQKSNKFKFLEHFCFFWHPSWPHGCPTRGDITHFTFLFEILGWWRHLPIFSFYRNEDCQCPWWF